MPKDQSRNVISVGTLPELVSLREAVLKSVGYEVFSTLRPQEALSRMREGYGGVLLLCYSVPDEWRKQLIQDFRERCPEGRIVAITERMIAEVPRQVDEL